ncbi:hypothetical protein LCGC14_1573920 [marine sediment metagenome]|uniref:U1-type domain-containing protein n=1 Tax=marine sediment metagenome TaxID=412755 RepID=A0A0F9J571_9ZZZZ
MIHNPRKKRTSKRWCQICNYKVRGAHHQEGTHHQEALRMIAKQNEY